MIARTAQIVSVLACLPMSFAGCSGSSNLPPGTAAAAFDPSAGGGGTEERVMPAQAGSLAPASSGAAGASGSWSVPPGGPEPQPPPADAIAVPAFPQPAGDPDRGYDYLINGDYQRLGPDLAAFKVSQPPIHPGDVLPGRRGDNVGLSYMFNAVESPEGKRVAGVNCLSCHATHLLGKLVIGLGRANRMVRIDDVNVLGIAVANPLALDSSVSTINRLLGGVVYGVMDVFPYLASHHEPQTLKWTDQQLFNPDAGVQGWVDIPPWWRTSKKNALYSNGSGRGVQGHHMSFMSIFSVQDTAEAAVIEQHFDDVAAYLRSIEPPPFPGNVDHALADHGEDVFRAACSGCHGTYGERPTYPNLIIPFSEVGTDPSLAMGHWMAPAVEWYAESWYARNDDSWLEMAPGYYAPPLDGIWATAPFFHNGSVPTLDAVIDPKKRPALWTSAMGNDDYDLDHVGWKNNPFEANVTLTNDFGTFDASRPGNSNAGHTYGADLSEQDQRAVLEYLKTL